MAFGEQRSRYTCGAAPRQGDFLAEGKLRQAREDLLFGVTLEFRRKRGREGKLHEIHEVQIAQEPQTYEARRARMKKERALDSIGFQPRFAQANFFEKFGGQIFASQEKTQGCVVERGILEERQQHRGIGMIDQCGEFVAGGGAGKLKILLKLRHDAALPRVV